MKYYKLIKNDKIFGIATTIDMRRYQKKHDIFLSCDESKAECVQYKEKMYRDLWMIPSKDYKKKIPIVDVINIEKDEYEILKKAFDSDEKFVIEEEIVEDVPVVEDDMFTFEHIKTAKILQMRNECNKAIVNGFDANLGNGEAHHFSMTIQDQLNLIVAFRQVSEGETEIVYHADNEPCRFYSPVEIITIFDQFNAHKTYHLAYFNSLKAYINSLKDIEQISDIDYGYEIPEDYKSEVLKTL